MAPRERRSAHAPAVLAATDAELHDQLLGTTLTLDVVALLVLGAFLWRRRRSGRVLRPFLGWGYLWVQYAGWWAFAAALTVLLLRVDSPRPLEIVAYCVFLVLTVLVGILIKRSWDVRDRPGDR